MSAFISRYLWLIGLILILTAAGSYYFLRQPSFTIAHPTIGPAVQAVYATGNVEATQTTSIAPRTGAKITQLLADEGDTVAAGQVLATLESADLTANIQQLQAREKYAAAALSRAAQLVATQAISKDAYQAAQAEAKAAIAARQQAQAQLGYSQLTAAAPSTIIQRDGNVGDFITASKPVFWLASGPLRITAQVDEEDILQVTQGQTVLIQSDNLPGQVLKGTVESVTPRGDAVSRSFRVRVTLPQGTPLKIGMTTEVNIILRENPKALLIPTSAVQRGKVWRVENGKVTPQAITIGSAGISQTEVLTGLTKESIIITDPTPQLKAGQSVRTRS